MKNKAPTVVKNFLSEKDISNTITLIDSLNRLKLQRETDSRTLVWNSENPEAVSLIKKYFPEILSTANMDKMFPHIVGFYRYDPGPGLGVHSDIMNPTCNDCKLSAILYFNNDFSGGEIFFPNLGIEVRPERGDLIFYPADDPDFDHGVRPISDGFRYAIPMCFTTNSAVACKYYL